FPASPAAADWAAKIAGKLGRGQSNSGQSGARLGATRTGQSDSAAIRSTITPGGDDFFDHRVHFRTEVLLVRMRAKPCDRFADADAKGFAGLKIRNKSFDLRIVEDAGVCLVAFEIAG